jgi:hypothetical protein
MAKFLEGFVLTGIAMVVIALAWFGLTTESAAASSEPQATSAPRATPELAVTGESPRGAIVAQPSTATLAPSATPDYALATVIAHWAGQTSTVQAAELEVSRNQAKLADALGTQNAIAQTAIPLTATNAGPAGTATVKAESTRVAEALAERTAIAYEPTAIMAVAQAEAQAQTATAFAWGQVFAVFGLGVAALVVAGVAVGAIRRLPAPVVVDDRPQVIHVPKPVSNGIDRIPAPPVNDYHNFVDWVGAVLAGETVSVDFWEQAGRFIGNYRNLHLWLVKNKLIMRHPKSGRAVINATGEQVLTGWLIANPLPQPQQTPKSTPPPPVHTDSVHTETEGEWLKLERDGE